MNKKQSIIEGEVHDEKALTLSEPQNLDKPKQDTEFAKEAAKFLVDIIKQNNWAKKLGGQSEHIQYEGWQTAGKYYGYSVKTYDAEYVELGGTWGFKAKAIVVNEHTGIEIGSAEAYCMSDEYNWKSKPKFQLASMAQTRAGSKALRQNLGFVIALAGFNPTPTEEMDGVYTIAHHSEPQSSTENSKTTGDTSEIGEGISTPAQHKFLRDMLEQKGYTEKQLNSKYHIADMTELTKKQASDILDSLINLEPKKKDYKKIYKVEDEAVLTDDDYENIDKTYEV